MNTIDFIRQAESIEEVNNIIANEHHADCINIIPFISPGKTYSSFILCFRVIDDKDLNKMYPIKDLDLSIRCINSLQSIGVTHLNQLSSYTKHELIHLRTFSTKSVEEIEHYMTKYNIHWDNSTY